MVSFTDLSSSDPTSWSWTFGDGGASTLPDPSHQYLGVGSYTVSLTAANPGGSDTETKANYITVTAPAPEAEFSAAPTVGSAPLTVSFTDLSSNSPTSWSWAFGDGGASARQNPGHEYLGVGSYTVSLSVSSAGGSDTETKVDYIVAAFGDVAIDHWAWTEILACVSAGIVGGYGNNLYHPEWAVDRAQMAVYISRALAGGDGAVPDFTGDPSFADVDAAHWALKYVEYAFGEAVVGGYGDGNYHPEYEVDRGQMAVFIARAMAGGDSNVPSYTGDPTFPDVPETFWAFDYIEYVADPSWAVVQGYPDGSYRPWVVVNRAQMAVYISRGFDLVW